MRDPSTRSLARTAAPRRPAGALALAAAFVLAAAFAPAAGAGEPAGELPPLGSQAKIRLAWTQWQHFGDRTAPGGDQPLLEGLANIGVNVFVDSGADEARAKLARRLGIRYYVMRPTGAVHEAASKLKARLAVDRHGLTCPEQFKAYKDAGGNVDEPWGKYGEHQPAYVPCPMEPGPWGEILEMVLKGAAAGWLDGLSLDAEPYGVGAFDQFGDMLCYCDDCFGKYLERRAVAEKVAPRDRYGWLDRKGLLDDYLAWQRERLASMLKRLTEPVRAVRPSFGFAMYPDFKVTELRGDWRLQGIAMGLHDAKAPFLVIDATPYWEDHTRPWWESGHAAYRKLGYRHVLGSWDPMADRYPWYDVDSVQAQYEFAMGSDGFWRWGERAFHPHDWRILATVDLRLRQVESKVGDSILRGEPVDHFVTLVEETGDPWLERALIARTFRRDERYLTIVDNANADWPVRLRVRFPRPAGAGPWRLLDALHDMAFAQASGAATWDAAALDRGLVVPLEGRGELFLLLEPAPADRPGAAAPVAFRSLEVQVSRPRPAAADPLPEPAAALPADGVVFTRHFKGDYPGQTSESALLMEVAIADVARGGAKTAFQLPQGFCREPAVSPDGKRLAMAVWVNGASQIYLANAAGGQARNISRNAFRDRSPAFSPDGRRIAFVSDRDGDWEIYSMDLEGADPRRLTRSPGVDRSPAWSPDGRRIAFISDRDGDFDVFVMDADGGGRRVLVRRDGNEYEPAWSPDGSRIACTVQRRWNRCVQICGAGGEDPYYVALGPATDLRSLRFSPDGKRLAAAFSHLEKAGVILMDPAERVTIGQEDWDGKRVKKLVAAEPIRPHQGGWYATGSGSPRHVVKNFSGVAFSPDGSKLVYGSDATEDGVFALFVIGVEGGQPKRIEGTDTVWPTGVIWAR